MRCVVVPEGCRVIASSPSRELRPPRLPGYLLLAIVLPALLVAVGMWLDGEYGRMRKSGDLVTEISQRRVDALDLVGSLRKAETAQRGFVITRNPVFLDRYEPSRAAVGENLARLSRQRGRYTLPVDRLAVLQRLIEAKFHEMDTVLDEVRNHRQADAVALVSRGRGQQLMDRIEAQLHAIIAADAHRLAQGRAAYWDRTLQSRRVVWLLIFALGTLLMVAMILLWLSKRERWRVAIAEADASLRNRAILNSTSDAIVILNPSGTIENVNAAARTVLGYDPVELRRRDISVVVDIADGDGSFHERIGLTDGHLQRTLFLDHNARTKDGRIVPVDVALGLMPVPDGLHIVASIRDISHRREIERIKDDFIATVSHELRTPLTSVVGSLGLLRAGAAGLLPDRAAQLVEIAENNARRLIRLTNDILDLEKFGSGQMTLELAPTDLVDLLRQAAAESDAPARAKSVAFQFETAERLPVMADRQRLLQVAANLLSNAVRHTPAGSTVTVFAQVEQGRAVAKICDEGPGVPDEYREHIFDRFVQAPVAGSVGGTGLGLAIAREIMQRHGGHIWVESAQGGGASFAFSLPLRKDGGVGSTITDAPSGEVQNLAAVACADDFCPTVLQIDDDVDLVKVVAAALAGEARVIRANGIGSARAILELESPDIVVLDIGLPDGSGLDVLPLLIGRTGSPLPTIVFSAQDSPMELNEQVEAVLVKSRNSIPMLRETIHRIVAERVRP
jgi:PAS domain S-box-containing protein